MRTATCLILALGMVGSTLAQPGGDGGQTSLQTDLAEAWRADPDTCRRLQELKPIATRNGTARFHLAGLPPAIALPVLADRLLLGSDPLATRIALAAAIAGRSDTQAALVVDLLSSQKELPVRRILLDGLRRGPGDIALPALRRALEDPTPEIREAALVAASYRPDSDQLGGLFAQLARDPSPRVRARAARNLGWLKKTDGWNSVKVLLADDHPEVRMQALQALKRIDAVRAAGLPSISRLRNDPDPAVASLARDIQP